ncbi:hypothetical protein C0989_008453 [Termitomyces sp. Mn162]|nr:hypothetical protein C0989_008453 [Termitomyces sp. Mn162]
MEGLPFKLFDEGCEAFIVMHLEVEEILLHFYHNIKDAKLTREFLSKDKPIGEHGVVGVKLE